MATSFNKIKKGLGLLDFLPIGKYRNCRIDSIIEEDDGYLRFMQYEKILVFDKSVMDALTTKFSLSIPVKKAHYPDSFDQINGFKESYVTKEYEWEDIPY